MSLGKKVGRLSPRFTKLFSALFVGGSAENEKKIELGHESQVGQKKVLFPFVAPDFAWLVAQKTAMRFEILQKNHRILNHFSSSVLRSRKINCANS